MGIKIAYFSAEFGIDETLPIYSGGLGILAGDHVKAANDLGIQLVGVGVLYRRGYFQQRIHPDGEQEALYPKLDPSLLPVTPVLDHHGNPILIEVPIGDRIVYLRIWSVSIGQVRVYLMDADHEANRESDRRLTDRLYGGDQETRISHELILGIGGVRVIRAVGFEPDVWHMNEGHVAFMSLERIREYSALGIPFKTALEAVRSNTLFTTHTPVPAGHDVFSYDLVDRYLHDFYWQLGADRDKILQLGSIGHGFNMTRLAYTTSSKVNGVSQLHANVSRELLSQWTPNIPAHDIAVEAVTNGVHMDTWVAPEIKGLYKKIESVPDVELWDAHKKAKERMIQRLELAPIHSILTIGFARRFATYKRATLLFRDLARLERILCNAQHPVCVIFAGKAHPADRAGQDLIRRIVEVSRMPAFRDRIFLIENYDMNIAKHLVQGVDVWLNTPLKPMEASGTSGMKAGMNGVLNCSVLDGWWNEGYNGHNGWAIDGTMDLPREERDQIDGDTVYRLLEEQIVPLYYQRESDAIPHQWVGMMKESIRSIMPQFNTNRMVTEYHDRFYVPLAERGAAFTNNHLEIARQVADYKQFIRENWHQVSIRTIRLVNSTIQSTIHLGPIWYRDVRVEAVGSDGTQGVWKCELSPKHEVEKGVYLFEASYPNSIDTWLRSKASVRVYPISPNFANDFELELVCEG